MNAQINVTTVPHPSAAPEPSEIILTVGGYYRTSTEEIIGKRRTARVARVRHIAMWICRKLTNLTLMEIGEVFGGRDHGTIIHGCRNVEQWIEQDSRLASQVHGLCLQLDPDYQTRP